MKRNNFILLLAVMANFGFTTANAADEGDKTTLDYQVSAKKLDHIRNKLLPGTGSSIYAFDQKDLDNLPQGSTTPLNQVLLQAPGVSQDSYGQIHVRNDHANIQYRINGIIIPEGIGGFGQAFDTHFADKINLLTGALPAQYGYRTAGVIDIQTKNGAFENVANSEVTVGSHATKAVNQEFSGSKGRFNYYLDAGYLENNLGLEAPTSSYKAIHDFTRQDKQFGYFSYLLNPTTRLGLIVANSTGNFEIPNTPGQKPDDELYSGSNFLSDNLNQKQAESNDYVVASLTGTSSLDVDYQLAAFRRFSKLKYYPDVNGELMFNKVASKIANTAESRGLQSDFSYQLNDNNILRSGFSFSQELAQSKRSVWAFPTEDEDKGNDINPINISDDSKNKANIYGLYLQNEWQASPKLTINYGARFDIARGFINDQHLSPRIGTVYSLTEKTKIHAGYANYFTLPPTELVSSTNLSQYDNTTNQVDTKQNDKVKAETVDYYDLGISHQLTSNLNLGLDGYYKNIHNLLDEGQFGEALILTPFNYQKAKIYGIELSANYHKDNLSSYVNLAIQKAKATKVASGQYLFQQVDLDYIANHYIHLDHEQSYVLSFGLSYLFKQTHYNLDGIYGSGLRKGDNNTGNMTPYTQFNFSVNREFNLPIINKFNARFAIVNLLDNVYQIHNDTGIGVGASQYGPRRSYYLTISKSF
jgi:outer membrane receptor protein involved in Fe transport